MQVEPPIIDISLSDRFVYLLNNKNNRIIRKVMFSVLKPGIFFYTSCNPLWKTGSQIIATGW